MFCKKKKRYVLLILFFLIVSLFPLVKADIISINAGGSNEFVLTADKYVEGFFFGIPSEAAEPSPEPGPGGGGGGAGGPTADPDIVVAPSWNPSEGINLAIGTTRGETINVTNIGTGSKTVTLTHNFADHLQIVGEDTLTIQPGQTEIFNVRFIAGEEPEIVAGTITIAGHQIFTTLEISSLLLLFDSAIIVLNPDSTVVQGDPLETLITLIPKGDEARLDVTMNFEIKDFENEVYSTSSETVLIEEQIDLQRNFNTGTLPPGEYIIGLELVYPNGVAPSSAYFLVVEREVSSLVVRIILFLIILILILAIIILIILILRKRREDEDKPQSQQGQFFPVTRSGKNI